MRLFFIFIFSFFLSTSFSQTSVWHFGNGGGLKFNSNGTTSPFAGGATVYPTPGNPQHTPEGSAVVTDKNGNVIFYTNGKRLWNGSNVVVSSSLLGGTSSTQSSLIVPIPTAECNKFLVFTTVGVDDSNFSTGLAVTLVDVTGSTPPYGVSVSGVSQSLQPGTYFSEKISATRDTSGGLWVVAHDFGYNSNGLGATAKTFYVYHITSALATATNTSNAVTILNSNLTTQFIAASTSHNSFPGPGNQQTAGQGQMKFSKDGKRLGLTIARQQTVDIFDFNPNNGQITFKESFQPTGSPWNQQLYGLEFSPNGQYLYIPEWIKISNERILQYDLTQPVIASTQTVVGIANTPTYYNLSALQLGPNDKIYVAGPGTGIGSLGVIDSPNIGGIGCNYFANSAPISGTSVLGLPNVIVSESSCSCEDFVADTTYICQGDSIFLAGSYRKVTGVYYDSLQNVFSCDSIRQRNLIIKPNSSSSFSTTICQGDSVLFGGVYVNTQGQYIDTLSSLNSCDSIVTLNLNLLPNKSTSINNQICQGDSIFLAGNFQFNSGTYFDTLQASNGCDSVVITNLGVLSLSTSNLSLSICQGDSVFLSGSYQTVSGAYNDTIINGSSNGCDSIITTNLNVLPLSVSDFSLSICQGDSILLLGTYQTLSGIYNDTIINGSFNGCDSIVSTNLIVNQATEVSVSDTTCNNDSLFYQGKWYSVEGIYYDTLVSTNSGCDSLFSVLTYHKILCGSVIVPNVFSPNGDGKNDLFIVESESLVDLHINIYNRWGQLLYNSAGKKAFWDGYTYSGKPVPEGTYYYIIDASYYDTSGNIQNEKFTGHIMLVRD